MSSNLPEFQDVSYPPDKPEVTSNFFQRNPLRNEWLIAVILFCLTLISTSFAGMFYSIGDIGFTAALQIFLRKPGIIRYGLSFSIPLISILLAHELGHFFACRFYRMNCTPPFFIPVPVSITGTMGAFIRIKSPFLNKRALFDIGVAGPLAGFALCAAASFPWDQQFTAHSKRRIPAGRSEFWRTPGFSLGGRSPSRIFTRQAGYDGSSDRNGCVGWPPCHKSESLAYLATGRRAYCLCHTRTLAPATALDSGHGISDTSQPLGMANPILSFLCLVASDRWLARTLLSSADAV